MNILFTLPSYLIEVIGKDLEGIKSDIESIRLPENAKVILRTVKAQIINRFKIFEEEINVEETNSDNSAYILMDFSNDPLVIRYVNYSVSLENKMKSSLTNDDFVFLEKFVLRS